MTMPIHDILAFNLHVYGIVMFVNILCHPPLAQTTYHHLPSSHSPYPNLINSWHGVEKYKDL